MRDSIWTILGVALVVVTVLALRFGTPVVGRPPYYDEDDIVKPIDGILQHGWSVETAIHYEETKGPAMIWPYAFLGRMLGGTIDDMRLVSVLFFVVSVWPLLVLCRMTGVRGPPRLGVVALFLLLPYHATLGQLLMSEASFIFGGLVLWVCVLRALEATETGAVAARRAWIVAYAVVLVLLVHHRIHAVAYAGAACLVALEREGRNSWPWWLASILAGALRVPLWFAWGGLVSPYYQEMFGLGVAPEAVVYLLAALAVVTAVFVLPLFAGRDTWGLAVVGGVGLVVGIAALFAGPDLAQQLEREGRDTARFAGIVGSAVRRTVGDGAGNRLLVSALAALGSAGLAGLALHAWRLEARSALGTSTRGLVWMLAIGIGLYFLTDSMVFDRYLLVWSILAPLAWMRFLPRWALGVQALALTAVAVWLVRTWLVGGGAG